MAQKEAETTRHATTWTAAVGLAAAAMPYSFAYTGAQMTPPPTQTTPPGAATQTASSFDDRLVDAKLAAVEARTDTKFAQLMGEMRLIATGVGDLKDRMSTLSTEVGEVRKATAGVKWNIVAGGLALGGLILGLFAFGTQILDLATGLVQAG